MIDLKWGQITDPIEHIKKHLLRFSGNAVFYENRRNSERRYFLKYDKKHFAICLPSVIDPWENIRWIFGWKLNDKIDIAPGKKGAILFDKVFLPLFYSHYFSLKTFNNPIIAYLIKQVKQWVTFKESVFKKCAIKPV